MSPDLPDADRAPSTPRATPSLLGRLRPGFWDGWFLVVASIIGLALLLILPPFAAPDETTHYARVSTMANGWLVPPLTKGIAPDYRVEGCAVSAMYAPAFRPATRWSDRFRRIDCGESSAARKTFPAIRRAEGYTAVPYAPAIVGYRLGRALGGATGSSYGARTVQLLAYIILMTLAIRVMPLGKPLLFAAALLPVSIQGAVGISADPMTLALAFLSVAMALHLMVTRDGDPPRASGVHLAMLGAVCLGVALSKITYVPLIGVVLAIPTVSFGTLRRRVAWVGSILGVGLVTTLAWSALVVSKLEASANPRFPSDVATKDITGDPMEFLRRIGRSWQDWHEVAAAIRGLVVPHFRIATGRPTVPLLVVALAAVGFVVIRLLDPAIRRLTREEDLTITSILTRSDRILAWLVAVGTLVLFFFATEAGLYVSGNILAKGRITGFQGRYFLPLLPLVVLTALPRRSRWDRHLRVAVPMVLTGLALWWCVATWNTYNQF